MTDFNLRQHYLFCLDSKPNKVVICALIIIILGYFPIVAATQHLFSNPPAQPSISDQQVSLTQDERIIEIV